MFFDSFPPVGILGDRRAAIRDPIASSVRLVVLDIGSMQVANRDSFDHPLRLPHLYDLVVSIRVGASRFISTSGDSLGQAGRHSQLYCPLGTLSLSVSSHVRS